MRRQRVELNEMEWIVPKGWRKEGSVDRSKELKKRGRIVVCSCSLQEKERRREGEGWGGGFPKSHQEKRMVLGLGPICHILVQSKDWKGYSAHMSYPTAQHPTRRHEYDSIFFDLCFALLWFALLRYLLSGWDGDRARVKERKKESWILFLPLLLFAFPLSMTSSYPSPIKERKEDSITSLSLISFAFCILTGN